MAMKTRKCLSCGTKYDFCPDCSGADRLAPSWKAEFCCEDCKTLWQTCTKFNMNKLTKAEAKAIISALKLKPADQYAACLQRDLKNIMPEEPKPKRGKRAVLAVFDEAIQPEIKEEIKLPEEEVIPVEEIPEVHEVVIKTEENE